jgi:nuclear pore complex protein Nup133
MQGAEQLSQAVLKSGWLIIETPLDKYVNSLFTADSEVVRQSPDLTTQLAGRKDRLSWLIGFINENGVLVKVRDENEHIFVSGSIEQTATIRCRAKVVKSSP